MTQEEKIQREFYRELTKKLMFNNKEPYRTNGEKIEKFIFFNEEWNGE